MARINLLPWRDLERARRQREFLGILGGAFILCAVAVLYSHIHVSGTISDQEARNTYLNAQITEIDKKIKEIKDLENTKARLLARMEVIQQLQGSRPEIVHLFDELAKTVPDGVRLTKLTHKGTQITLQGDAQSNARVSAYMRNLDSSDWLVNPKLDVIQTSKEKRTRASKFVLLVSQAKQTSDNEDGATP